MIPKCYYNLVLPKVTNSTIITEEHVSERYVFSGIMYCLSTNKKSQQNDLLNKRVMHKHYPVLTQRNNG
jgi:hypothetical protein